MCQQQLKIISDSSHTIAVSKSDTVAYDPHMTDLWIL